jgi:uncharacterized protein YecT (DUF1311 family)
MRIRALAIHACILLALMLASILTARAQRPCYFLECGPSQGPGTAPGPSIPPSPAPPSQPYAPPSFDCATHFGEDEMAVCRDANLAMLDRRLSELYDRIFRSLPASRAIALRDEQRSWLRQRAACRSDVSCLNGAYSARITQLTNWR